MTVFHLAHHRDWAGRAHASYVPAGFDAVGFVHCSTAEQVDEVAHTWFAPDADLVLLELDTDGLDVRWVDSHADGRRFPHVHQPIPLQAVVSAQPYGSPDVD